MKHTFTVGTCRYTVQVQETYSAYQAVLKRRPDLYGKLTIDDLMADRVAEVTASALKKPRKPTVRADKRVYPRWGATASTAEYVREYHLANAPRHCAGDVKAWVKDFYQPLSERVTIPQGEYSEEICLSGC